MNANKTESTYFKPGGAISTPRGKPLKLVGQFIYLYSNISSTETDINKRLAKAWAAIDRLSVLWKFDLSDKMGFLSNCGCVHTTVWMHHMEAEETL